jgi:hypothetical protein
MAPLDFERYLRNRLEHPKRRAAREADAPLPLSGARFANAGITEVLGRKAAV